MTADLVDQPRSAVKDRAPGVTSVDFLILAAFIVYAAGSGVRNRAGGSVRGAWRCG